MNAALLLLAASLPGQVSVDIDVGAGRRPPSVIVQRCGLFGARLNAHAVQREFDYLWHRDLTYNRYLNDHEQRIRALEKNANIVPVAPNPPLPPLTQHFYGFGYGQQAAPAPPQPQAIYYMQQPAAPSLPVAQTPAAIYPPIVIAHPPQSPSTFILPGSGGAPTGAAGGFSLIPHTGGPGFTPSATGGPGFTPSATGGPGFTPSATGGPGFTPGATGGPGFTPGATGAPGGGGSQQPPPNPTLPQPPAPPHQSAPGGFTPPAAGAPTGTTQNSVLPPTGYATYTRWPVRQIYH